MAPGVSSLAQVNVYTRSYNGARTGANLQETILTPANVNPTNFGKLFTVHVDGQVYAQPLYVSSLAIAGGTHNVVFVATMRDSIYALDADNGAILWNSNFGTPITPQNVETDQNIVWTTGIGILSTPVIDPDSNILYFVTATQGTQNGNTVYGFQLNAIEIATGLPVKGSPVSINATYATADLTTPLVFNAKIENNRPGLALANGNVYIAFASHEDQNAYHGWVLAYSASTLAQVGVYADTTIGYQGGIWNAGQAPAFDSAGNLYLTTGNGSFGKTTNNLYQTGNSFVKLSPTLQLLDYFTPYNSQSMNSGDMDLGSAGVMLVPNTNYVLGGGKQGILYLVDTGDMGEFNASGDHVKQEFQAVYGVGSSHIHGTPAYFNSAVNGPTVYVWGENDYLREFLFNATTGLVNTTPLAKSNVTAPATNNDGAMPGGFLSVSANGNTNGIVWASTPFNGNAVHQSVQGVLYAYDADTLALLWTDKTNDPRDEIGMFAKYCPPMVANGKMYVPNFGPVNTNDGTGNLVVYGLLKPQLTVNVANATMTAGQPLPTFTGTVSGLENGDTLGTTINVTYITTATSNSAPGTYAITATVSGSSAGNYQVVVNAGTLNVSASNQVLTITANNATRTYGTANPVFTGTVSGAKNGDTFTESFSTTANAASNVGNYVIVPSVSGANLNDYTVDAENGVLSITAASTAIALTAPSTANYGASVSLTATVSSSAGTPGGTVTFYSGTTSLGTVTLNGSGVATLNTAALPGGTDSLTAAYAATGNFAASGSSAAGIVVSAAAQTINFPAIAAKTYGNAPFAVAATSSAGNNYPVTITVVSGPATVNKGVVTLTGTGTVNLQAAQAGNADYSAASTNQSFVVNQAPLKVAANNATRAYGVANPMFSGTVTGAVGSDSFTESFTTAATTASNAGSYAIVPSVSGSALANYAVNITNGSLTITAAGTTTSLSAPASAAYGAAVNLVATVTSTAGSPAGMVTFYSGSTSLGTGSLNSDGVASLSTTALQAGSDSLTASYVAAGNFAASSSSPSNITINAASQTITFAAIASRAYGSAPFAVTATSNLGSSYPVTITVQSGPALISNGVVTLTGAGNVTLLATQAGNAQSAPANQTQSFLVTPAPLTVSANNASRPFGAANPTFTGSVTGAVGNDSFTETFTTVATATSNAGAYPIVPAVSGPQLANYSVTLINGSLTISALSTTTTLNAPGSAVYGASTTLTATVTSASGTPSGIVNFYSGSSVLGTGTLNGSGVALLTTTTLAVGTDQVTASYAGTSNFSGSNSSASTISVSSDSQSITFAAIGSHTYGDAPFAVSATSSLGSSYPVTLSVQSGPAVMSGSTVTLTGAGAVVLKATQPGDATHSSATASQGFQVAQALLTVTANSATRAFGAANPTFSGSVTGAIGSDSFSESFTTAAAIASNVGSYAIVPLASGAQLPNYTVTVVNGSLTVTAAATTTTLSAPTSATAASSVTLTATVASTAGVPGGAVTFYDGSNILGTGTLNASGVATLTTTTLPTGNDSINATYLASGNYAASSSVVGTIQISLGSQSITFPAIAARAYSSPNFTVMATSSLGSSYPVTIAVQSGPATIASGLVHLTGVGTVVLQATQAGDSGHAAATATQSFQVTPAMLTVSAKSATRIYGEPNPTFSGTIAGAVGSDRFDESFTTAATATSNVGAYAIVPSVTGTLLANYTVISVDGSLTVTAAPTTTTLSAPGSAASGAAVSLTATVASTEGAPAGKVSFLSGATLLGSGTLNSKGVATLSTTQLANGKDTVTATFAAADNFAASTSPAETITISAAQTAAAPGYTLIASQDSLSVVGAGSVKTQLTVVPSGNYSGTIALSCEGLPANASCVFGPNTLTLIGDNRSVNLDLTIQTTLPNVNSLSRGSSQNSLAPAFLALAFWWPGSMTGLAVLARRRRLLKTKRLWQVCLLLACTSLLAAGITGCGSTGVFTHVATTTAQVTVVATGNSGSTVTTQNLILTLQMTE